MKNRNSCGAVGLKFKMWVLVLKPTGFGPYLPLPRGDGSAAEKGSLLRGWAQGRDGPELPSPGAPQARLIELPFVVGVFWAGRLGPLLECGNLPADEATPKVREGSHETHS
jgi:hypothetical protein